MVDSKKVDSWKSELRNKETPYDINITGTNLSPSMSLSNGVEVKYISSNIREILELPEHDVFIVTEGIITNSCGESVSLIGDIFDEPYRELFSHNPNFASTSKVI